MRVKFNTVSRPLNFFVYGFIMFGAIGFLEGLLLHHKIFQFYSYTLWPSRMKSFDEYQDRKQAYIDSKLRDIEFDGKLENVEDAKRLIFNSINKPSLKKAEEDAALRAASQQEAAQLEADRQLQASLKQMEQQMVEQVVADRLRQTDQFQAMRKLAAEQKSSKNE